MAFQELCVALPGEGLAPRPTIEPLFPGTSHLPVELPQAAVVRRAAVILVVASHLRVEGFLLLGHIVMSMRSAPIGDSLEAAPQALLHRLDVDRELPLPAPRAFMREAEEVEGVGFGPLQFRLRKRGAPEFHQACLFWMERQPVLRKPLG